MLSQIRQNIKKEKIDGIQKKMKRVLRKEEKSRKTNRFAFIKTRQYTVLMHDKNHTNTKYPLVFTKADIVLLNKVDSCPYLDFDEEFFIRGFRALGKNAPKSKVSSMTGEGFGEFAANIEQITDAAPGGRE